RDAENTRRHSRAETDCGDPLARDEVCKKRAGVRTGNVQGAGVPDDVDASVRKDPVNVRLVRPHRLRPQAGDMGRELHRRRHFAISRGLCRYCFTSHPVATVASTSILPCASDSFARQEEEEEEEDAEDAADRESLELDDPAGLAESDPVFGS